MKKSKQRKVINQALRILLITNGLTLIAAAMLGPIYAIFVEGWGGSLLDASLTAGVFSLVGGLTSLIAGKYADKVKRDEWVVAFGNLIMGVGFFLFSKVNSIYSLFIVQAIIGFGGAIYAPAFDAIYSKHLTKRRAGTQWGAWESMSYFTAAIGATIGGLIATKFGFNILFYTMSILTIAPAVYLYLLPKGEL